MDGEIGVTTKVQKGSKFFFYIPLIEDIKEDIKEDETPKSLGYTLCAYTLNKAFEKARELVR